MEKEQTMTPQEFDHKLKHEIPADQRKQWAEENRDKIVYSTLTPIQQAAKEWHLSKMNNEKIIPGTKDAFEAGAEWQKEQSGWISVQKRLPTEAEINSEEHELLFYGSKRGENKQQQGVHQGYFDTQTKAWMFQPANLKPEFQGQFYDIEKFYSQDMWFVTHWILVKLP